MLRKAQDTNLTQNNLCSETIEESMAWACRRIRGKNVFNFAFAK